MSTEDQSRKTKKGRTEKRRRKESGSLLVWVLRTGRSSMVEPARAYNYPATIAQSFFAPHKPHHHNKVASRRWGGREEEEEEVPGRETPEEVSARGRSAEQKEQSLKGDASVPNRIAFSRKAPTAQQTIQHKSHKSCP